ncbi:MAG: phospholipid carrier-dependent glycosyltransferase [Clostridia bacterium]|nr:phospholipid carrier-dependent glycosyltransferase [Clostridia bacterium]
MFFGDSGRRLNKLDVMIMLCITVLYGFIGFYKLGSLDVPQTAWYPDRNEVISIYSDEPFDTVRYYCGIVCDEPNQDSKVGVEMNFTVSKDGSWWTDAGSSENFAFFQWRDYGLNKSVNYLKIKNYGTTVVNEIVLLSSEDGHYVDYEVVEGSDAIHDEFDKVPENVTYYDGGYFDEVYYPRTVVELMNGSNPFEMTHPPLGKYIMLLGVLVFGLNPFGWRFMGVVAGIVAVPCLYHLCKRLTGKTWLASFGALLFCFEGMHYVMMRIGTLDVFVFLFVMLMYDTMLCFMQKDIEHDGLAGCWLPLSLSGLFFGLGAATKWNAVYGGLGLALLYFGKLVVSYRSLTFDVDDSRLSNRKVKELKKQFRERKYGVMNQCVSISFGCIVFFILVPFLVYMLSFIPVWLSGEYHDWSFFDAFVGMQKSMYGYHSGLDSEHTYQSMWYEWPIMQVPMLFSNHVSGDLQSKIMCMGNPAIWLLGLLGFVAVGVLAFLKKKQECVFIFIGGLSVYLPWMLISRITFIYHYFPMVLFLVLSMVVLCNVMKESGGRRVLNVGVAELCSFGVLGLCLVGFCTYFCVFSGFTASKSYIDAIMSVFNR